MASLRRTLYLGAVFALVGGLLLAVAPHLFLVRVFDQPPYPEYAGARMLGVGMFSFGLLLVIVANHLEDAWWWSWAFVVASVGFALVAFFQAILGDGPSGLWWGAAAANSVFSMSLMWGLARTGTERPPV
ncbi:MAG: hypothetical protein ABR600_06440 [Actinomycetota bacterium]